MLIRKQGLDSPERLSVLIKKNANGAPDRRQQVSVIAQENLKLAAFLFHHRWRCTFGWEVMRVHVDIVHLLAGQMKIEDDYKDPDRIINLIW